MYKYNRNFIAGGIGTWDTSPTLPNILKVFNPNLIGYSNAEKFNEGNISHFSLSAAGVMSSDMTKLAEKLITKIKNDKRVNFQKDWKMITHLIGNNDYCNKFCGNKDPEDIFRDHTNDLLQMLRLLRDNMPRTIVNIIPSLHVGIVTLMEDKPTDCNIILRLACQCFLSEHTKNKSAKYSEMIRKWQELDIEISNSPEFDLEDFTVIPHYLSLNYKIPATPMGGIDYSYLSTDCFHFSEKGHNAFGLNLWNSLLEPFGKKNTQGLATSALKCPTDEHPFIITRRNSPRSNT